MGNDRGSWLERVRGRARLSFSKFALLSGGAVLAGIAVIIALTSGGVTAQAGQDSQSGPVPVGRGAPQAGPLAGTSAPSVTVGAFSGIVLPDLLILMPSGLAASDITGLRPVPGVRKMIAFAGAQITLSGKSARVIGVNPEQFRPWGPLR